MGMYGVGIMCVGKWVKIEWVKIEKVNVRGDRRVYFESEGSDEVYE